MSLVLKVMLEAFRKILEVMAQLVKTAEKKQSVGCVIHAQTLVPH